MNTHGRLTWYSIPSNTLAMVTLVRQLDCMEYVLWSLAEGIRWMSCNYEFIGHNPRMPHIPNRLGYRVGSGYSQVMQQYLVITLF